MFLFHCDYYSKKTKHTKKREKLFASANKMDIA